MRESKVENAEEKFVSLVNVNKYYDNGMHAVVDFNLDIKQNEFIVFVGPSGCGKSTTLRMVAGLEDISGGQLIIEGNLANDLEPVDRDVAMVFQSYALYPNMTIYDNMAFPLEMRKDMLPSVNEELKKLIANNHPEYKNDEKLKRFFSDSGIKEFLESESFEEELKALNEEYNLQLTKEDFLTLRHYHKDEIKDRVVEAARILEIEDQLYKKPKALSGGQRQRVALGRAIVRKSKILLMDEPLSNLDAKLRVYMRSEIVRLHQKTNSTTIYVTHDQTEAMTMADRIVVMSKGYVQQIGTPEEIYKHPSNMFVASFIGSPAMNFVDATYDGNELTFKDGNKIAFETKTKKEVNKFYEDLLKEWSEGYQELVSYRSEQVEREWKAKKHLSRKPFTFDEENDEVLKERREGIEKIKKALADLNEGSSVDICFGIRPEAIKENTKGEEFTVDFSELLGDEYYVHFYFGEKRCLARVASENRILKGDKIHLEFVKHKIHFFDPISKRTIF